MNWPNRWDHLHPAAWPRLQRRSLPCPMRDEYITGWRWGLVCGVVLGALLAGIVAGALWPQPTPYIPVYEHGTHTLIGWCGGVPPASIPQFVPDVDVTWYPRCPR